MLQFPLLLIRRKEEKVLWGLLRVNCVLTPKNKYDKTLTNNTEEKLINTTNFYKCYKLVNTLSRVFDRIEA